MKRYIRLALCCVFAASSLLCGAQGFDDLKSAKPVQLNSKLQSLLDNNDAKGLERLLKSKADAKDGGSSLGRNEKGAPNVVPLFNDVIARTLAGKVSPDLCRVAVDAGCDVYSVYNGKTPVYQLMDYFATTPSAEAGVGMQVLDMLFSRKDFDINRRYRSLAPPFSYLLSTNYKYLGDSYSKDYLSAELLQKIIEHGGALNTYDENGASLLLLANSTDNRYLQNYLVDRGININKAADETGNNAVYAAIESGNVEQLRRIVANYNVVLTTGDVISRKDKVSPEMYAFLAEECARNAKDYAAFRAFRSAFPDKADLVKDQYEAIARREIAAAGNYDQISHCEDRFPDLYDLIAPRRRAIAEQESDAVGNYQDYKAFLDHYPTYQDLFEKSRQRALSADLASVGSIADVKAFEQNYPESAQRVEDRKKAFYESDGKALRAEYESAKRLLENHRLQTGSSDVEAFMKNYTDYYDPDKLVPIANALSRFYTAVSIASAPFKPFYSASNEFWNPYVTERDRLREAISACSKNQEYGLSSDWLMAGLRKEQDLLEAHYKECEEAVKLVDRIGLGNVPSPRSRFSDPPDYSYTFADGDEEFSFRITDYSDGEGYVFYVVHAMKGGKLPGFIEGYSSMEEAITAGYAAGTLGFRRTVGRAYRGGLLTAFLDNQRHKLNINNARETDLLLDIISSWFE